jgi:hypothetical protein
MGTRRSIFRNAFWWVREIRIIKYLIKLISGATRGMGDVYGGGFF